jgi:aspartyl-tRNA(Asn)/glutamyl-tRNA(Gln) amidotransferase subunit A
MSFVSVEHFSISLSLINIISDATSKFDARDPTSLTESTRIRISQQNESFRRKDEPLRIGIPLDYNTNELDPSVRRAWTHVLQILQSYGHTIVPVSLPSTKQALSAYYILAPAEASSNLARYDGVRFGHRNEADHPNTSGRTLYSATRDAGLGAEVKRRILLGSYTLSAEAMDSHFMQAQRVRRLVQRDFDRVFLAQNPLHSKNSGKSDGEAEAGSKVDVLLCPTAPNTAPRLADVQTLSPVQTYTVDVFTVPASLAGLPAISIPLRQGDGLAQESNIGMQIIGQFGSDELVLTIAALFEAASLSKAPAVPSSVKLADGKAHVPLRWFSDDLARSYVNMRRFYGGGMAAVQYFGNENRSRPGNSRDPSIKRQLVEGIKGE